MPNVPELTAQDLTDLCRLTGFMVPASAEYRVPAANDAKIFADIVRSLGRDWAAVVGVLAELRAASGGTFAELDAAAAQTQAFAYLAKGGAGVIALGRAVLQCYYRDDRVIEALGLDPRPPFPRGHAITPGDWSLLEPVKKRPRMWRDVAVPLAGERT